MNSTEQYREAFREEAGDLLGELEAALLELEERPEDGELVGRVFRALHTVKGSGAMFGFDAVSSFAHEVETVYDRVRSGRLPVGRGLIDATLRAKDLIRSMLVPGCADDPALQESAAAIVAALRSQFQPEAPGSEPRPAPAPLLGPPGSDAAAGVFMTYRVRFRPGPALEGGAVGAVGPLQGLRGLGECKVVAGAQGRAGADPQTCYSAWDAILTTDRGADAVRGVFGALEGRCDLKVEVVDDGSDPDAEAGYKKLGDILIERGDVRPEVLAEVLGAQKRIGQLLEEKGIVAPEVVQAALLEQQAVREARAKRAGPGAAEPAASIRVAAEKLDILVDRVGELVIAQARLSQIAAGRDDPDLFSLAEEIERLSAELRDTTLNVRMLPIGTTFGKFRRLVHDLAAELHKEMDLATEGAETELDKTVIERLGDPLVHLIRNSCDHGIETPARREAAGKPRKGRVRLAAYHSGANVFIEIQDDGAGLDPEAIRAAAVEKALLAPDARPSDRELFGLIFQPGFSTARTVSSVSGRGVGMDVVKRSIDALRGVVEIESLRGEGTTIRIKLPLTLAIIEGLLVRVEDDRFVLPLAMVEECIELTREDVAQAHGRRLAPVRGELVPYVRLREWFASTGEAPAVEQIVVANVNGCRTGFVVDEVVGQHQTVIKSLGKAYEKVEGLSGATILGDGAVALIVDLPKLLQSFSEASGVC